MERTPKHVIFASYGNDSIALIQWAYEKNLDRVAVVYSNTGWAAGWWAERVKKAEAWVRSLGFVPHEIQSEGMKALVRRKKGWPRQGMQFCTTHLKIEPAKRWLDEVDPGREALCLVGVRREESRSRASWPEYTEDSENHGGRTLWAPLVRVTTEERDALLERAGWAPLPHRSMECAPCVNANRADLRAVPEETIEQIAQFEAELGYTKNGKLRTMFRPASKMGAVGIREVKRWADSERGKYEPLAVLGNGGGCDSGMCSE